MKFEKNGLQGSYDKKHDILYIYLKGRDPSYATEELNGLITMRSIETEHVTGYLVYDFEKKVREGSLYGGTFDYIFRCAIKELQKEL